MSATIETSKGHAGFYGAFEYFYGPSGDLFRAPQHKYVGVDGYRVGAQFEACASSAEAALMFARQDTTVTVEELAEQPAPRGWECVEGGTEETTHDNICPECSGLGYVAGAITFWGDHDQPTEYAEEDCTACNGEGVLRQAA